jgi:hypothetical protein
MKLHFVDIDSDYFRVEVFREVFFPYENFIDTDAGASRVFEFIRAMLREKNLAGGQCQYFVLNKRFPVANALFCTIVS